MAFTDVEKTDIRRFCGYPAYGSRPEGFNGWRFFQASGTLEYRMQYLSGPEEGVVRHNLATLRQLEAAIPAASATLDTEQAAVWTRNAAELTERLRLFDEWRRRLCGFLGLPPGPALSDAPTTGGAVRLVV
jgi:hypothetical protein